MAPIVNFLPIDIDLDIVNAFRFVPGGMYDL
jgi:hypothetical protein